MTRTQNESNAIMSHESRQHERTKTRNPNKADKIELIDPSVALLPNLQLVAIGATNVPDDAAQRFRRDHPKMEVIY